MPENDLKKSVWVYAEEKKGEVPHVVYELLGKGKELAEAMGGELAAFLSGDGLQSLAGELGAYGAEKIYVIDDPGLKDFNDEPHAAVIAGLIREKQPDIVLAGATARGRSLMPRVASKLKTGLTADCTELRIDPETGLLQQTRPAYGGNIMATIITPENSPQMATVRPNVMKKGIRAENRQPEIETVKVKEEDLRRRTELLEFVSELTDAVKIEEAEIIVSGGRGLQKPENFSLIEELAHELGAAVGASRAAVDAGWISYAHQVGQTGKTVCPKIYIACGISGAIQHLIGMQTSDVIIAINKDKDAPIFEFATFGIVGDIFEIIPKLIAEIRKDKGR